MYLLVKLFAKIILFLHVYPALSLKFNVTLSKTRKSCSETNMKSALRYRLVCDGYVKYDKAVNRSAIMQEFRDNERKKQLKKADWRPFWIF